MDREGLLVDTFVTLADTLVDDYDVVDFMQMLAERCVELLDVSAGGIMLAGPDAQLRHVGCSNERMRLVELFELQCEEGPCLDAYREQRVVTCDDLGEAAERWPRFARYAQASGFEAVSAVPMRLRSEVIGALNLFSSRARRLGEEDTKVAQAMADVATIGILQQRALRDAHAFADELQAALRSRVVIEQAKGVISEHDQVDVDEAFVRLRRFARTHHQLLSDIAGRVVSGEIAVPTLHA